MYAVNMSVIKWITVKLSRLDLYTESLLGNKILQCHYSFPDQYVAGHSSNSVVYIQSVSCDMCCNTEIVLLLLADFSIIWTALD